jgi:hypothetical protein
VPEIYDASNTVAIIIYTVIPLVDFISIPQTYTLTQHSLLFTNTTLVPGIYQSDSALFMINHTCCLGSHKYQLYINIGGPGTTTTKTQAHQIKSGCDLMLFHLHQNIRRFRCRNDASNSIIGVIRCSSFNLNICTFQGKSRYSYFRLASPIASIAALILVSEVYLGSMIFQDYRRLVMPVFLAHSIRY